MKLFKRLLTMLFIVGNNILLKWKWILMGTMVGTMMGDNVVRVDVSEVDEIVWLIRHNTWLIKKCSYSWFVPSLKSLDLSAVDIKGGLLVRHFRKWTSEDVLRISPWINPILDSVKSKPDFSVIFYTVCHPQFHISTLSYSPLLSHSLSFIILFTEVQFKDDIFLCRFFAVRSLFYVNFSSRNFFSHGCLYSERNATTHKYSD